MYSTVPGFSMYSFSFSFCIVNRQIRIMVMVIDNRSYIYIYIYLLRNTSLGVVHFFAAATDLRSLVHFTIVVLGNCF